MSKFRSPTVDSSGFSFKIDYFCDGGQYIFFINLLRIFFSFVSILEMVMVLSVEKTWGENLHRK